MAELLDTGEDRHGFFLLADMEADSEKDSVQINEEDYNEKQMEEMIERGEPWFDDDNLPSQTIDVINVPKLKHVMDIKKISSELLTLISDAADHEANEVRQLSNGAAESGFSYGLTGHQLQKRLPLKM